MARRADAVTVIVPASTSNLGSGFDTLGLALNLPNRITVRCAPGSENHLVSALPEVERAAALRMVADAASEFFRVSEHPQFSIAVSVSGKVPVARGVGYSATIRLAIVAALNVLTNARWNQQQLLEVATRLEGHPDNVSPALYGGFTVSGRVGHSVRCLRFEVSRRLKVVALFPRRQLSTEKARAVLPETYDKPDLCHALNRAALITAAFAAEDYSALRGLFDDRVHQPYRQKFIPELGQVIRAGEEAGALGGFLSGAGSGIICLTLRNAEKVASAMHKHLPDSEVRILSADNQGLRVV